VFSKVLLYSGFHFSPTPDGIASITTEFLTTCRPGASKNASRRSRGTTRPVSMHWTKQSFGFRKSLDRSRFLAQARIKRNRLVGMVGVHWKRHYPRCIPETFKKAERVSTAKRLRAVHEPYVSVQIRSSSPTSQVPNILYPTFLAWPSENPCSFVGRQK
jgi:hypothetical protein